MIRIKYIPNILSKDGRVTKELEFSRGRSVAVYIDEAGFDIRGSKIIVSGKATDNLDVTLNNEDEIIVTPDVRFTAVAAFFTWVGAGSLWWGIIKTAIIVASVVAGIYSMVSKPRKPTFNSSGVGIDESSPTYGWDGIQTTQEIGTPIPVVYGEHKAGGNIINTFIRTDGDKNYLNVLLGLSEGEIESIEDVKINDNPASNYDNVTVYKRFGTNLQSVIPNFEDAHNLYNVNVQLTQNNPHTYTTVDNDVEAFEIHLQFPGGIFLQESDGAIKSWSVTYKVEYKLHSESEWIDLGETTVSEKSRSVVRRVYRKAGLAPGQYDIRVTRTSEDSGMDPLRQGDLTWVQLDEIKTDDHAYPNTALLGIEALADDQLSGSMPNFSCVIRGRKVKVPDVLNAGVPVDWEDYYWNSENSEYRLLSDDTPLTWDGSTYVDKWSANPIWCMKDLLTNKRYGLGEFIDTSLLDEALFLEMSRYCEEKVPDGEGGYEKRFRLDVVIDSSAKALDIISQLSASFRGLPFYSEGAVKLRIDKLEEPAQLFTMGNIIKDSFNQSWKSIKEVPNILEVQYLDRDKDYKQEVIAYVDEEALANGEPMRKKQVRIFTTRISQAIREARYALKLAKYINKVISFKAGIDAIACQAGDVISVSHDVPQWGFSGRVIGGSTLTKVVIDQDLIIEDGKTYKIMVQFSDDAIEERVVTNSAGVTNEITIDAAFSQVPSSYDKYAFGESNKVKKDFRIISMVKNDKSEVEIQAVEHNANVYDDSDITIPTDNFSSLDLTIPNVTDLKLTERLIKLLDGTIENCIDVWFDIPKQDNFVRRFSKAKIYLSDDNSTWSLRGETTDKAFHIIGDIVDGVTYYVKVVSVTEDNEEGSSLDSPTDQITIVGKSAPPSDVTSFLVNQNRDRLYFGWTEIEDVDTWGYEIRWGTDWDSGIVEATVQGDHYLTTNLRKGTAQKYWIKAIDTSGNYSLNAKEAVVTIDEIPFRNIIEEFFEEPLWSGDKVNTEKDGDNLKISDGELEGTYTTPIRDVGYVATFYVGIEVIVSINQGLAFDDDPVMKFNSDPSMRFTGTEVPGAATFKIRTSEDNVVWTDWLDYQAGDYKCRFFQIKMTLKRSSVGVNLICSTLDYYADLPDVDEYGGDVVAVAEDGKGVTFEKTFREEPVVNVNVTSGDGIYSRFTEKDTLGFTVKLYDASGVAKAGDFEFHAHGV